MGSELWKAFFWEMAKRKILFARTRPIEVKRLNGEKCLRKFIKILTDNSYQFLFL